MLNGQGLHVLVDLGISTAKGFGFLEEKRELENSILSGKRMGAGQFFKQKVPQAGRLTSNYEKGIPPVAGKASAST